jgi:hypothetical protein
MAELGASDAPLRANSPRMDRPSVGGTQLPKPDALLGESINSPALLQRQPQRNR